MSKEDKIEEVTRRSLPLLPAHVRHDVEAIAIMEGVLTLWVISHFFGIDEIADVCYCGRCRFGRCLSSSGIRSLKIWRQVTERKVRSRIE